VKLLITIPIDIQGDLLKACDPISPKYRMLKNGLLETDADGRKMVKILCESEQANDLLAWAHERWPDSAALIIVTRAPGKIN
jgi:hypothetical protein